MDLKDKTAIVTGGARGIGRGIALELAKAGANIVIADLPVVADDVADTRKLIEAEGRKAVSVQTNVRDFADCQSMAQAAVDAFGSIDILVNNAGVVGVAPVATMSEEEWDRVIGVNLALELGGANVTVNAICPGLVDSAMWRDVLLPALGGPDAEGQEAAWKRFIQDRVPLGRPQTVEDIGRTAVFLCQADNITGESINVTGGGEMG